MYLGRGGFLYGTDSSVRLSPSALHESTDSSLVGFSATTLVVTMITILACAAPNFQSAKFVFADTTNSTGWSNDGLAFLLCIANALYGFLGE
jgi:choline transport protein